MIIFPEEYWLVYINKGSFPISDTTRQYIEDELSGMREADKWTRIEFTDITGSVVKAFKADFSAIFKSTPETRDAERHQSAMIRAETSAFNLEHNTDID